MKKPVVKSNITNKPKLAFVKREDKDALVCVSCGYSGHGTFDEETHQLLCPECGANLDEGDLLRYKTPQSYAADDDASELGGINLGNNLE